MKEPVSIVQSVHQAAVREVNTLEKRIIESEDDADSSLWEQARQVVALLEAGMSQRDLAKQWINGRTGDFYSRRHIQVVIEVASKIATCPRPRFRDAYNKIANMAHVGRNAGEHEWYTPPEYIAAARAVMGGIDLDPASTKKANETVGASTFYTADEDGLDAEWAGNVWMNPPYEQPLVAHFSDKLAKCYEEKTVKQACVLVNNATETAWFQRLLGVASAVCFVAGRVRFLDPDGEPGAPLQGQAVIYLGAAPLRFMKHYHGFGTVLLRKKEAE